MTFLLGCIFGTSLTSLIYGIMKVRDNRKKAKLGKEKKENE